MEGGGGLRGLPTNAAVPLTDGSPNIAHLLRPGLISPRLVDPGQRGKVPVGPEENEHLAMHGHAVRFARISVLDMDGSGYRPSWDMLGKSRVPPYWLIMAQLLPLKQGGSMHVDQTSNNSSMRWA